MVKKKIMFDLSTAVILMTYLSHPNLLKLNIEIRKNKEVYRNEQVEKYKELLQSVSWFLRKAKKYQLYFEEFYSKSPLIPDHEALEHHVHAYIEDLYALREKLLRLSNTVKNDVKKIHPNNKQLIDNFEIRAQKIIDVFSVITSTRVPHVHAGFIHVVEEALDAQMAQIMLETPQLRSRLTEEGVAFYQKMLFEKTLQGKIEYQKIAESNYEQLKLFTDMLVSSLGICLYEILGINSNDVNTLIKELS